MRKPRGDLCRHQQCSLLIGMETNMRILVVTQLFPPEMGAQSNRLYPIVRGLIAAGHTVFVATGMPNYPQGVIFPEYQGKRSIREEVDGFTIFRAAYFTAPRNKSKWTQLRSYLSFIPAAFRGGLRAGKVDLIFVTSPPLFSAIPAIWLAKLRRARLVLDIRDLWPDEIIACGGAPQGSLPVRVISAMERRAYLAADYVCCTTQSFVETVVERGVSRGKTLLVPNGADLGLFRPLPSQNPVTSELPFNDRFVVMYSGVLGLKHGIEVILEAAYLLRGEEKIFFCLIGSGARREALIGRAESMGLKNVIFAGERRVEDIPFMLARADVCLSALMPDSYLDKIITVKVFEYLACEKPVVAALAGETARVLNDSGGGMVVPPGDSQSMADAILDLYRHPERRVAMGKAGRRYVEENFSRSMWAARLEVMLKELYLRARSEDGLPESGETIVSG
jgi:colanic acid biosynthesis glycosyl transferase WcaI